MNAESEETYSGPARTTATFEEYYWEAYNEIVQPRRFDWYLIHRWLPELGPEGFALVKVLRSRCYFNPKEGTLRNTCELPMEELAALIGMKRSTLYREFDRNAALRHFVVPQHQYVQTERKPQRCHPQFLVCMDDPIHPLDRQRYEELRQTRERERLHSGLPQGRKFLLKSKSQNGTDAPPKSQFETPKSQIGITTIGSSLPSETYIPSDITLNVGGGEGYRDGGGAEPPRRGHRRDVRGAQLDAFVAALVAELDDAGSVRRHRQLLSLCDRHGLTDLAQEALFATRRRQAATARHGPLEKPGAYYQSVLVKLLEDCQVFVPAADPGEREAVRAQVRESLGLVRETPG